MDGLYDIAPRMLIFSIVLIFAGIVLGVTGHSVASITCSILSMVNSLAAWGVAIVSFARKV